mmetsp:Transcript_120666/g.346668  ORF Transcript_120666/g.346668 Transcript_120666/m.346668 type:complete len:266 (+) Transcript_120666:1306-2103(+)
MAKLVARGAGVAFALLGAAARPVLGVVVDAHHGAPPAETPRANHPSASLDVPTQLAHPPEEAAIIWRRDAAVRGPPTPLQCARVAFQVRRQLEAHPVEARARRQVPALGVPGVDGLAVAARVVRHAIRWRRCALQPVLVQAALRARRGMPDVLVADAELEVPAVVRGDLHQELHDLARRQRRPRAARLAQHVARAAPLASVPADAGAVAALGAPSVAAGPRDASSHRRERQVAMARGLQAEHGPATSAEERPSVRHGSLRGGRGE